MRSCRCSFVSEQFLFEGLDLFVRFLELAVVPGLKMRDLALEDFGRLNLVDLVEFLDRGCMRSTDGKTGIRELRVPLSHWPVPLPKMIASAFVYNKRQARRGFGGGIRTRSWCVLGITSCSAPINSPTLHNEKVKQRSSAYITPTHASILGRTSSASTAVDGPATACLQASVTPRATAANSSSFSIR